jgi:plastocyanin domain-containing protein
MLAILIAALLGAASTPHTIDLAVTEKGFEPAKVTVKKGEPVHLVVTRRVEHTCATEIQIKEAGVREKLPLNKPVSIELTPTKSGELRYACGMGMLGGVLLVE